MDYGRLHQKQLLKSFQDSDINSRAPFSGNQKFFGKRKLVVDLKQFLQQDKPLSVILLIAFLIFIVGALGALFGSHPSDTTVLSVINTPLPIETSLDTPSPTLSPSPAVSVKYLPASYTPYPTVSPSPVVTPTPTPSPTPTPAATSTPSASASASPSP